MKSRILALALVAGVLPACYSSSAFLRERNRNKGLQNTLREYKRYHDDFLSENEILRAQNAALRKNVLDTALIQKQKERLQKLIGQFEAMGVTGEGLTVVPDPQEGGFGLRVEGGLLFSSGKADLTTRGRKTLDGLIPSLRAANRVRIDGHTDSDPIKSSSWKSNLHLSAARALAVGRYLIGKGVQKRKVQIMGYGDSTPVSTEKRLNRRVEIFMKD